jgi:hypothetical protein
VAKVFYGVLITVCSGLWAYHISVAALSSNSEVWVVVLVPNTIRDLVNVSVELHPETSQALISGIVSSSSDLTVNGAMLLVAGLNDCQMISEGTLSHAYSPYVPTLSSDIPVNLKVAVDMWTLQSAFSSFQAKCAWRGPGQLGYTGRQLKLSSTFGDFSHDAFTSQHPDLSSVRNLTVSVPNVSDVSFAGGRPGSDPGTRLLDNKGGFKAQMTWSEQDVARWRDFQLFVMAAVFAYGLTVILDDVATFLGKLR